MDKRIKSFMHDAPKGREHRLNVQFECLKCGRGYSTLAEVLVCLNSHEEAPVPEKYMSEYIAKAIREFQEGKSSDFMCLIAVETPAGNSFKVNNSSNLISVLQENIDYVFPSDYGKPLWNLFQHTTVALLTFTATYIMYLSGTKEHWLSFGVMAGGLSYYVYRYWKARESGHLGYPIPIIPWRISVAMLAITVLSFVIGWVVK